DLSEVSRSMGRQTSDKSARTVAPRGTRSVRAAVSRATGLTISHRGIEVRVVRRSVRVVPAAPDRQLHMDSSRGAEGPARRSPGNRPTADRAADVPDVFSGVRRGLAA